MYMNDSSLKLCVQTCLEHCRSSILPLRFEAGREASKVHDQMLISVTLIFIAMSLILQLSTRVQL